MHTFTMGHFFSFKPNSVQKKIKRENYVLYISIKYIKAYLTQVGEAIGDK